MGRREHVDPKRDAAVLPSVRSQPCAAGSVHSGRQPRELSGRLCLPKAVNHWSLLSVQIKLIKIGASWCATPGAWCSNSLNGVPPDIFRQAPERIGGLHTAPGAGNVLEVIEGDEGSQGGGVCPDELEGSENVVKAAPLPGERQSATPRHALVSFIGWLTALVSDTTTALVEHGALPWSR